MAKVRVEVETTTKGAQNIKESVNGLQGMEKGLKAITASFAAVAGAGATFKKAFDLSREGANLTQLTKSFNRMNESVFRTPDLLDQMSQAARGTIKETDLMAGLLKLTAGASEDMAKRFADAAPQLLEIAKASNALNPSLGDTAFLYDSIATGIKRASPLILDNLGIVVKVGEANAKYAEQLGKSVEALTAEEKQIALLNATLEAGGNLIQQVGGDVGSQADAWERLAVRVGAMTDAYKIILAEGLNPVISALAGDYRQAAQAADEAGQAQAKTMEELVARVTRVNEAYDLSRTVLGRFTGTQDEAWAALERSVKALAAASSSYKEFTAKAKEAGLTTQEVANILNLFESDLNGNTEAWYELAKAAEYAAQADIHLTNYIKPTTQATVDNRTEAEKAADAIAAMGAIVEDTQTSYAQYTVGLREAKEAQEAAAAAAKLAAEQGDFFTKAIRDTTGEQANLNSILYEAADAAGADAEALALLAYASGEYSKEQLNAALQTAAVTAKAQELAAALAAGDITVREATQSLQEFAQDWQASALVTVEDDSFRAMLRSLVDFDGKTFRATAKVETEGSIPGGGTGTSGSGSAGGDKGGAKGAVGLDMIVPPGYANDSFPVWTSSGERVVVQTPGQQMGGGGGFQVGTVNIYAQPGQNGEQLYQEFSRAAARDARLKRQ